MEGTVLTVETFVSQFVNMFHVLFRKMTVPWRILKTFMEIAKNTVYNELNKGHIYIMFYVLQKMAQF